MDGFKQDPIDGTSMVYTFASAKAPGRKSIQYFDNNGSRGIYHDGWYACTFGPLTPWLTVSPGLATWDSNKDVWELYDLKTDFSQADDLASKGPEATGEDESAVPQGSQGEQGVSHRRGHLAAAFIRKTVSRRPTRAGSSTRRRPACRSSPHPAWAARAAGW